MMVNLCYFIFNLHFLKCKTFPSVMSRWSNVLLKFSKKMFTFRLSIWYWYPNSNFKCLNYIIMLLTVTAWLSWILNFSIRVQHSRSWALFDIHRSFTTNRKNSFHNKTKIFSRTILLQWKLSKNRITLYYLRSPHCSLFSYKAKYIYFFRVGFTTWRETNLLQLLTTFERWVL